MRILFISANRIGDAVITTGLLDHLVRTYPHCRITVACGPVAEGVFARMPNRERTILFAKRPWRLHWPALWWRLVRHRWDLVVDLRGSAMGYLLAARRRAVLRRVPGRKFEQFAAVLGVRPAPLPVVWTAAAERDRAAVLLPGGPRYVGFGPTANWLPKTWPAERFAALFHALEAGILRGAVPVIFAGPGQVERDLAAPLAALLPEAINLTGRLALPEVAACMQRCAVYIGNDSGLMHLAAAAAVPTVGLCATTMDRAEEMAPAGICARWAMGDGPSMDTLAVGTALAAVTELLARAGSPG